MHRDPRDPGRKGVSPILLTSAVFALFFAGAGPSTAALRSGGEGGGGILVAWASPVTAADLDALRNPSTAVKLSGIRNVKGTKDPRALQALVDLLGDRDTSVQRAAFDALGDSITALEGDLGSFTSDARDTAAQTFKGLVRSLAAVVQRGDSGAQSAAGKLLAKTAREVADPLRDVNTDVQRAAAEVFVEMAAALGSVLQYADSRSQGNAADALDAMAKELSRPLRDRREGVQKTATDVSKAISRALNDALRSRGFRAERQTRATLATLTANLAANLRDREAAVRELTARALGEMGFPTAVEPLIEALSDEDAAVVKAATAALARIAGTDLGDSPEKWKDWWAEHRDKMLEGK